MGYIANLVVILFYASPLSTFYQVIKTKNSNSINIWVSLTCLTNCILWLVYGLCIRDWFVAFPNFAGIAFAVTQIVLKMIYPSNSTTDLDLENKQAVWILSFFHSFDSFTKYKFWEFWEFSETITVSVSVSLSCFHNKSIAFTRYQHHDKKRSRRGSCCGSCY